MPKIADEIEQAEKEWGVGGGKSDFHKLQEGDNIVRILTPLYAYPSHYNFGACVGKEHCPECKKMIKGKDGKEYPNKPSVKFLCNVMVFPTDKDKADAKANNLPEPQPTVKIGQFSYTITKALQDLQEDEDYAFDDFPMPYNVKIKAKGAGTKEVEYSVIASPKRTNVPDDILAILKTMNTPEQIRENFKKAQMKKLGLIPKDNKMAGAVIPPGGERTDASQIEYPEEEINPDDIPF